MSKRSWVFLRGLCRGRGHWGDFPELFRARFPEDEVEMIDLPGNGERCEELSPWNIADYLPRIQERSQFLKDGKPLHLLGVSLGGMIAAEWARQSPDQIAKLYLGVTSSQFSPFYHRMRPSNYFAIARIMKNPSVARREEIILSLVANNQERIQKVLPGMVAYSERYPLQARNFFRQITAASGVQFASQASVPTVLIGAYGDRLVSPQCTLRLARQWGLEPRMHPNSGHDIPVDDPLWLIEQLA